MPVYCFTNRDDGDKTVERVFRAGRAPQQIQVDGRSYRRDLVAEHRGFKGCGGAWPQTCTALNMLPDQVPEQQEILHAKGVHTDYDREGSPIFENRSHRAAHLKALGYFDKDAGYSDPAPR